MFDYAAMACAIAVSCCHTGKAKLNSPLDDDVQRAFGCGSQIAAAFLLNNLG